MSGAVEILGSSFRAHLQRRDVNGRKMQVRGPRRGDKRKAEQDLHALRAAAEEAAASSATGRAMIADSRCLQRHGIWNALVAESRRLQERADFEARVSASLSALAARSASPARSASSLSEESDAADISESEPGDSQEHYSDSDELWQDIDDEGRLPSYYQPPPLRPLPDPKDEVEATALLSKFRPVRNTVEDLKKLLDARADPDIIVYDGDICPLMKVMAFANKEHVGPMRDLLLRAGATEDEDAKERWEIRRDADACEEAWLRNFHRDPALVPCE